jgi:hypothetical protein
MGLFNITWRTQVTRLLPSFKRIENFIDFLTSLVKPLDTKATEWVTIDADFRKRAKFNGQHLVLAEGLNNIFGVTGIRVETVSSVGIINYTYNDSEGVDPWYVYNNTENQIFNYFYNSSEIVDHDFVVLIPVGIYTAELDRRITEEVKTYKLAGKTFITQTY